MRKVRAVFPTIRYTLAMDIIDRTNPKYRGKPRRVQVIMVFKERGVGAVLDARDIAVEIGWNSPDIYLPELISGLLSVMAKEGYVVRVSRGFYSLPDRH